MTNAFSTIWLFVVNEQSWWWLLRWVSHDMTTFIDAESKYELLPLFSNWNRSWNDRNVNGNLKWTNLLAVERFILALYTGVVCVACWLSDIAVVCTEIAFWEYTEVHTKCCGEVLEWRFGFQIIWTKLIIYFGFQSLEWRFGMQFFNKCFTADSLNGGILVVSGDL